MASTTGTANDSGLEQDAGEMANCIEACTDCHEICLATMQSCLSMGGVHARPEHIGMLLDCAQICATSADFMTRGSRLHHVTCGACAELCRACAQSCRQLGGPQMQACAEACERCAESCGRMAAHGRGH
jgi:hypothetical protein